MTDQLTGAGIFESYSGLVSSITSDSDSETEKVLGIAFGAIDAVASTVGMVIDPLGTLLAAGVGWLIEHLSFLREPLDMLMGDPDQIQAHIDEVKQTAADIRQLADDHKNEMSSFEGWSGESADAFKANMDRVSGELDSWAEMVEGTAKVTAVTGTLVVMMREIVRDLISSLIGTLLAGALIAAAMAVFTFGASIAAFVGVAVGKAVAVGVQISSKIAKLVAGLARQASRLGDLGGKMGDLSKNFDRFSNVSDVADAGNSVAQAAGAY